MISLKSYFFVLCDMIAVEFRNRTYYKLCEALFYEPYEDTMGVDPSITGGIEELRDKNNAPMNFPHSMLEMMISIAIAMNNVSDWETYDSDLVPYYFWDMMTNIRIDSMDDEHFDRRVVQAAIDSIKQRSYCFDGSFGLFGKLEFSEYEDIRSLSLWDQAMLYVSDTSFEGMIYEED